MVLIGFFFGLIVFITLSFFSGKHSASFHDLDRILARGEITFITRYNAHCYYLYRDRAMGFEYDLAKAFADDLGVRLNLKIANDWKQMAFSVANDESHIIAANMTISPKRMTQVAFADSYLTIRQHLIVHRDNRSIRHVADLSGLTVHVKKDTAYQERLESLKAQGIDLTIQAWENNPTVELIRQVETGEIDVTVAYSNVAMMNQRYYPHIFVADAIGGEEHLAWAVHPDADRLRERINAFFKKIKANGLYDEIYNLYYTGDESLDFVDLRSYHRFLTSRLPEFGRTIKAEAEYHGFDWRLIAAQIYQESHFSPDAQSRAGAHGLMQLTRETANSHGVLDPYDPVQNIRAGVRHLKRLYDLFDDADGADRIFIALGAYNVGQGHIRDAQRLALKKGYDPSQWASIAKVLPLLQQQAYYQEARYGYCHGMEPVRYVKRIMIYYDILKHQSIRFHTDAPGPSPSFSRRSES